MARSPRDEAAPASPSTRELAERVDRQVRRMGAQSVLTSHTVAGRFGLNTTDLECLDLVFMRGRTSPGELAKATGLTSGAMTALLDRLEDAGYITRTADPDDRRRVQVRVRAEAIRPIDAVYRPMQREMFKLWSTFTAGELQVIERFLSRSIDLAVSCTERIREDAAGSARRRRAQHGAAASQDRGAADRNVRGGRSTTRAAR